MISSHHRLVKKIAMNYFSSSWLIRQQVVEVNFRKIQVWQMKLGIRSKVKVHVTFLKSLYLIGFCWHHHASKMIKCFMCDLKILSVVTRKMFWLFLHKTPTYTPKFMTSKTWARLRLICNKTIRFVTWKLFPFMTSLCPRASQWNFQRDLRRLFPPMKSSCCLTLVAHMTPL